MNDFVAFSRIKDGDIGSFETLFKRYYEPLCLYAGKIVKDMDVAEEIVQQLFYTIWSERTQQRLVLAVKSYLFNAVRNLSLKHNRHIQVREHYRQVFLHTSDETISETPQEILEYKDLEDKINAVLEHLPERRRKIFYMSRFDGLKYAEIAQKMALSVKTVEAEMSKALKEIKKVTTNHE